MKKWFVCAFLFSVVLHWIGVSLIGISFPRREMENFKIGYLGNILSREDFMFINLMDKTFKDSSVTPENIDKMDIQAKAPEFRELFYKKTRIAAECFLVSQEAKSQPQEEIEIDFTRTYRSAKEKAVLKPPLPDLSLFTSIESPIPSRINYRVLTSPQGEVLFIQPKQITAHPYFDKVISRSLTRWIFESAEDEKFKWRDLDIEFP